MKDLLVASHVKPWSKSNNYERIDTNNALLLCLMYDSLFDKGYISFNNNSEILISTKLSLENYSKLNIKEEMKIDIPEEAYNYFKWYRKNVFRK